MQNLVDILRLAEIEAEPMGLVVVDTRLTKQGKRRVLEVSICRKGGRISLDDCEELSRKLDKVLDEHEPPLLEGAYMLEVQSPGLDRQLKTEREFEIFANEQVEVITRESFPALGNKFTGTLQSLESGVLTIANPQVAVEANAKKSSKKGKANAGKPELPESISIDWTKVAQVRLHAVEPDLSDDETTTE
jgi:ribosome maturation factor RimP